MVDFRTRGEFFRSLPGLQTRFGLSPEASIAFGTAVGTQSMMIPDAVLAGRVGLWTGAAISGVDVIHAVKEYNDGTASGTDIAIESSGFAGAVAGGVLGAKVGVVAGTLSGPF